MNAGFRKGNFWIVGLMAWVAFTIPSLATTKSYIIADFANERLCASTDCPSTNKLYQGQVIEIFEVKGKWARVSKFYDSEPERAEFPSVPKGLVARWIRMDLIGTRPPLPHVQPKFSPELLDTRIAGIPAVGEYGLSELDVTLLRKYSLQLINSSTCAEIEYGDKSVMKKSTYYVVCKGENLHRFFKQTDVQ